LLVSCLYVLACRLFELILLLARGERSKELEILGLRHELSILRRRGRRPQFATHDRLMLAALSRVLPRRLWRAFLVRPETLLRWHRRLVAGSAPSPGAAILGPPAYRDTGSHVPRERLDRARATSMPGTTWAASRPSPRLIPQPKTKPRFRCHRRVFDTYTVVRFLSPSRSTPEAIKPPFPIPLTTPGMNPTPRTVVCSLPPAGRLRRAHLHHSRSTAPEDHRLPRSMSPFTFVAHVNAPHA
jgi:hypothetical protein